MSKPIFNDYVPNGAVTGRSKQKLILTLPSPKKNKVGSEAMSLFCAKSENHSLLVCDLDSCESVLFGLLGDALTGGEAGSTPVSYIGMTGDKDAGTDVHSLLAKAQSINRNDAKTVGYSVQYGAGIKKVAMTLHAKNPDKPKTYWLNVAKSAISHKKGYQNRQTNRFNGGIESPNYNAINAWHERDVPHTNIMGRNLTTAMRSDVSSGEFVTSKGNIPIQGEGNDMLNAWIVFINYFARRYNLDMELSHTVHDMIAYHVHDDHREQAAFVVHWSHRLMYETLCEQMGLSGLPSAIAYPASVDIGKTWAKAPGKPVVTPSYTREANPNERSYTIHDVASYGQKLEDEYRMKQTDIVSPKTQTQLDLLEQVRSRLQRSKVK